MNFNEFSKEKLGKLIFVELNAEKFIEGLGGNAKELSINELYIPINPKYLNEDVKKGYKLDKLPITYFIEGMFYAIGGDKNLRFNEAYFKILPLIKDSVYCVKGIIADNVKKNNLADALIFLIGLWEYEGDKEVCDKALYVCEALRESNSEYNDVQLELAERAKEKWGNEAFPYLYSSLAYKDKNELNKSFIEINEYLKNGGERSSEIEGLYNEIKDALAYEEGKDALLEDPNKALAKLLPLADKFPEDAILKYYIGTCYRRIDNFEKAIYYLNESLELNNNIVEVVNELGINYASLNDFDNAIKCFRKAFEATKDVEICTNLIMSYINIGDLDNAKKHLKLAEALNKDDEIVIEIKKYLEKM